MLGMAAAPRENSSVQTSPHPALPTAAEEQDADYGELSPPLATSREGWRVKTLGRDPLEYRALPLSGRPDTLSSEAPSSSAKWA